MKSSTELDEVQRNEKKLLSMLCETLTTILMDHVMVGNMHMIFEIHGAQAEESRPIVLLAVFNANLALLQKMTSVTWLHSAVFKREHCQKFSRNNIGFLCKVLF